MTSMKRNFYGFDGDYTTTQFLEEVCSSEYINTDADLTNEDLDWGTPKRRKPRRSSGAKNARNSSTGSESSPKCGDKIRSRKEDKSAKPEVEGSPGVKSLSNLDWLLDFKLTDFLPLNVSIDNNEAASPNATSSPNKTPKKCPSSQNGQGTKQDRLMERIKQLLPVKVVEDNNNENNCVIKETTLDMPSDANWNCMKKPPFTYTELIEHALRERGGLTVSEIYNWISEHFPFYRAEDDRWKNSVRHNLSINPHFRKGKKAPQGAGHLWELVNSGMNQVNWQNKQKRIENFIKLNRRGSAASSSGGSGVATVCDETEIATQSIERMMQEEGVAGEEETTLLFEPELDDISATTAQLDGSPGNFGYDNEILELNSKASLYPALDCEEIDLRQYRIESNASIEEINLEDFNTGTLSGLQDVSTDPMQTDSGGWILVDEELQNAVSEILRDQNGLSQAVEVQYIVPYPRPIDSDMSLNNDSIGGDSYTTSSQMETIYYTENMPLIQQYIETEEEGVSL